MTDGCHKLARNASRRQHDGCISHMPWRKHVQCFTTPCKHHSHDIPRPLSSADKRDESMTIRRTRFAEQQTITGVQKFCHVQIEGFSCYRAPGKSLPALSPLNHNHDDTQPHPLQLFKATIFFNFSFFRLHTQLFPQQNGEKWSPCLEYKSIRSHWYSKPLGLATTQG